MNVFPCLDDKGAGQVDGVGPRQSMPWGSTVISPLRMASSRAVLKCFGQEDFGNGDLLRMNLNRERFSDLPLGLYPLPAGGCGSAASKRCCSMMADLA